ncbi:MAG: rhomboid family intramembrane serine protease [Nanoarchaeota archaeon]|nr:rhomboid family intramembrane serine protease [Nanoarchaeota archaeon]
MRESKLFSTYTEKLILINILTFFGFLIFTSVVGEQKAATLIALQPASILAGKNLWTFITSMFAHAGLAHLFVNMFSLFFIGNFVEKLVGKKRFLAIYLASGIFAGLFFVVLSGLFGGNLLGARIFGDPSIPGVGASGALFGLVGVLAMLTPRAKVYLIAGPLVAIILQFALGGIITNGAFMGIISMMINIYFIFSIFTILSFNSSMRKIALPIEMPFWILPIVAIVPLIIIGLFISLPIGNMAHLGGLIAGLIYAYYLKEKYPKKTKMISSYFSK